MKSFLVVRRGWTSGTFVDVTRTFGRTTAEAGVRTDYESNLRGWTSDPRGSFVLSLTPRQRLRFAFGRYHEAPPAPYFDGSPQGGRLLPEQARHAIAGYEFGSQSEPVFVRIEAYDKRYTNLPMQAGDAYDSSGYGYARGVDTFVTRAWRLVTLRANASWLAAARRWTPWDQRSTYPMPPSGTWAPDFDIPYTVEAVAAIKAPRQFAIDAAWRTAAGRPSTPAIGATPVDDGYLPVWGPINSDRLPRYERFDLSVSRSVRVAARPSLVFATVGNALDRRNVSAYTYSPDYRIRTTVPGGSPRTIYVGITIR